MKASTGSLIGALIFAGITVFLVTRFTLEWWSLLSLGAAVAATIVSALSWVRERRAEKKIQAERAAGVLDES